MFKNEDVARVTVGRLCYSPAETARLIRCHITMLFADGQTYQLNHSPKHNYFFIMSHFQ